MSIQTLQLTCFLVGLTAYLILTVFCAVTWLRGVTGRLLFAASLLTLLFTVLLGLTGQSPWSAMLEAAALYTWFLLTLRAMGLAPENIAEPRMRGVAALGLIASLCTVGGIAAAGFLAVAGGPTEGLALTLVFVAKTLISVCGLVGLEQLVRNTRDDLRWRGRYLYIGLGLVFGFSLLDGAVCLLFKTHIGILTLVQPAILALAAPLFVVASLRNRTNRLSLNLSREFVFRSGVLITTGALLTLMALGGYYLRATGNDVASASVLLLITATVVTIAIVAGSTGFRIRLRRLISRNFFDQQHDYRAHWARVTEQLTEPNPDFTLEQQSIRSILGIFDAPGGALWRWDSGQFVHCADLHTEWSGPLTRRTSETLLALFRDEDQILELSKTGIFLDQASHEELSRLEKLAFLVPLVVHDKVLGMVGVRQPPLETTMTDEDRDLVRLVSREAAGFLALRLADEQLSEARQFDTMSQLTTFLVHDLKTTSAQLSLLLDNAALHKRNPEFVDDMLSTVEHSVSRMGKLIRQVAERREDPLEDVPLNEILQTAIQRFQSARPQPVLGPYPFDSIIRVNRDKLVSAIEHALDNAVQATDEDGTISLHAECTPPWMDIQISDTGCGMSDEFIAKQLFQPFSSTKGVSGMGIGAFQLRAYLRSMGGDVLVKSSLNRGSRFTLRVPMTEFVS